MNAALPQNMVANQLHSQWLEGTIRHRRKAPVRHEFSYSTGMLALDLREWPSITHISRLFSLECFNWLSLYRRDYFRPETDNLLQAVSDQVQQATGWRPDGAVQLITHPRYFGYVFNPVSFYFCYHAGDRPDHGAVPRVIMLRSPIHPGKIAMCTASKPQARNQPVPAGALSASSSANAFTYRPSIPWISITSGRSVSAALNFESTWV